jgi:apolipoprotein N-acyltransferase
MLGLDIRTFISAILLVLAFPPWDLSFLAWVALIPWLDAVYTSKNFKKAFTHGFWLGFFMTLAGFYWVAYVMREFAGVPWIIAIIMLLVFALFNELQFPLLAPLIKKLQDRLTEQTQTSTRLLALLTLTALFYAGADWCLPKLFVDTLGHTMYEAPRLRQIADIGGAPLITFLIVLVNLVLWTCYRRFRDRKEPSFWPTLKLLSLPAITTIALITMSLIYGSWRSKQIQTAMNSPSQTAQLGVIQANIGDIEKIAAQKGLRAAAENVITKYSTLSDQALKTNPRLDALVWPETAYPSNFRTPETSDELARDQYVERYVRSRGVPLLFGGYDRNQQKDYNSFFFLSPTADSNGQDLQTYHKNKLLIFGEYIPGMEYMPLISRWFPQVANFGRGNGPEVLNIPTRKIKVSPIICYEALFPNYIIPAARQGSQMILNITNDSWFGPWGEPELHLALTTFRSIEARLPQVRSTNTGISALILPNGEISQQTGKNEATVMNVKVPLIQPQSTLMLRWGDWFALTALIASALGLVALLWRPAWLPQADTEQT